MFEPNREELAWAAGFFDGEGSTCFHKQKSNDKEYLVPCITITQAGGDNGKESLARFQRAVGGLGRVNGPYRHKGETTKNKAPFCMYRVNGFRGTQAVIAMLWTFLGRNKKDQAKLVLQGATK